MENIRKYGKAPFKAALIHGGPGAAGEMAPVAAALSADLSVLEPLQTACSLDGQAEELKELLQKEGGGPFVLAGFSWGAWLAFILASRHPGLVKKLILIGSGPFEEQYSHAVTGTRFARLGASERAEAGELIKQVEGPASPGQTAAFARLGGLLARTDAYDPEPEEPARAGGVAFDAGIFQKVWKDAVRFRRSGALLSSAALIKCPVTAIHGDHDPHPAAGVSKPLKAALKDFKFIPLKDCGHRPWIEKAAKQNFYDILKKEILT
ncbi:MAG: alpha/beta hydrolase [Elusimicrobiales bacterium]|jgi:pimeloyl-ACP methyl ester carboxylesterase